MIINAYIKEKSVQVDGRMYVTEIQVDDQLGELEYFYLAEKDTDVEQVMAERTVDINNTPQPATIEDLQAQYDELSAELESVSAQLDEAKTLQANKLIQ